jgi:hypothetical protein
VGRGGSRARVARSAVAGTGLFFLPPTLDGLLGNPNRGGAGKRRENQLEKEAWGTSDCSGRGSSGGEALDRGDGSRDDRGGTEHQR